LIPSTSGPGFVVLGSAHIAILGILVSYLTSPYWLGLLPWFYGLYLFYAPLYMLWKMELLFRKPPTAWIRTAREARPAAAGEARPAREGRPP
jgi:hypothetical protein